MMVAPPGEPPDPLISRALWRSNVSVVVAGGVDDDFPILWANPAFERLTGYRADELRGRNCRILQGPDTDADAVATISAAVRSAASITETILNYRMDGTTFWNELTLTPVVDARGVCTHTIGIQVDVSARIQAQRDMQIAFERADAALDKERQARELAERTQQRLMLQSEVTMMLAQTLDVPAALRRLGDLLVPQLADWIIINLVEGPREDFVPVAAKHVHGRHETLARLVAIQQASITDASPQRQVLASGVPIVHSGIDWEEAQSYVTDGEALRLCKSLGIRATMFVPLIARSQVFGVITLVSAERPQAFGPDDVEFAVDLAQRAAITLDNARLYAAEHTTAVTLQRSLLRPVPPLEDLAVSVRYLPGRANAEVGGDWYEVMRLPDGAVGVVIGDVMGHDVSAAAAMGQLSSVLRSYAWEGSPPATVLTKLDRIVRDSGRVRLVTCVFGRIERTDSGSELVYANAGHLAPLLRLPDGRIEYLAGGRATVIGIPFETGDTRRDARVALPPGSVLLLFTDGLVETRTDDLTVGLDQVATVLARHDPVEPLDTLSESLAALAADGEHDDDVCILAVRT